MIQVGHHLPAATLRHKTADGIQTITVAEVFDGKRVVLFAVPAAFSPTCSDTHLPGFVTKAAAIRAKGVDAIVCVAVNDAHVLDVWSKASHAHEILMLSDGNAEFAKAMGLDADLSKSGMGVRSRRYAAIVDNGVVSAIQVEPAPGVTVSSADAILAHL